MLKFENILAVICIVVSIVTLVYMYVPIIKQKIKSRTISQDKIIEQNLEILRTSNDPKMIAKAFEQLMSAAYIRTHVLVNTDNTYKDAVQYRKFKETLTERGITKLKTLEAEHGKCPF